eukprot:TRINITY_DN1625_c0_g2_i4.p2 TRINITY_DN1625_c0_g2~~TRINITY_DN1625_c0_g2_i4.p2  ORF type:complete len:123 (+),score=20.53 TRINITY_DN1625_c0_g2_i4:218-586(+)
MELSLLCGNDVLLIIRESSGSRTILYSSLGDNNKLFKDILVNHEATHSYSNLSVRGFVRISTRTCLRNRLGRKRAAAEQPQRGRGEREATRKKSRDRPRRRKKRLTKTLQSFTTRSKKRGKG